MKKILNILFIGLVSVMFFPFSVSAGNISTLDVINKNNKLTVSGTTENGVLAVAVLVYSGDDLIHMETCSNKNNKYSCELGKTFETKNYTVKVADYNGGNYISKNIGADITEKNPQTLDNITLYLIIGIISIVGISGSTFYLNKKNKKLN